MDLPSEPALLFHGNSYSRFQRSVALPCSLDKAHIETEFDHGLLLVRLSHCNGD
ncbi:MAG: Hsp20 family protein [Candidatus Competibacterales bacterium]